MNYVMMLLMFCMQDGCQVFQLLQSSSDERGGKLCKTLRDMLAMFSATRY